ncbi:response regulator [candidate division TA06 bacterium]|nr:response regulator [candidate division TA06 bacterium]
MNQDPKPKVLVADDEPTIVNFFIAALSDQGYEIESAVNGAQAVEKALSFLPDVILLDVMMPELNGYQVTEKLKANPATEGIPIVLVTGLGSVEDKVQGLESGADDFLTKPFNLQEMLARVHSLIKLKKLQDQLKEISGRQPMPVHIKKVLSSYRSHILIVEDDERITNICKTILGTGGYIVDIAPDGEEAQKYLQAAIPDLILLDLMLPGISGLDLLKQLKEDTVTKDVPVIIITALGDLKTKVKSFYMGVDDYLVKPVNSLELLARVKANIRKHMAQQELKYSLDETFQQSITDPLTGLYNRHYLDTVMDREVALFKRHGRMFSLMIMDIDNFKPINDNLGHLCGDQVLTGAARILKDEIRSSDLAVRYGGDEFIVIFSDTKEDQAMIIAQRIRAAVEQKKFIEGKDQTASVSIGLTQSSKQDNSGEDIIKRADDALYQAKRAGKNRVVSLFGS